jgi:hypothetical protein
VKRAMTLCRIKNMNTAERACKTVTIADRAKRA